MTQLWLTSDDSIFWTQPRAVEVTDLRPGPENGAGYARLEIGADQPDGPRTLLARSASTHSWTPPAPGRTERILVWNVGDPAAVWTESGIRVPTPQPSSWCVLAASYDEARAVAVSVGGMR